MRHLSLLLVFVTALAHAQLDPPAALSLQTAGDWELLKVGGADGIVAPDAVKTPGGGASLKLTKTAAPGYLVLRATRPLSLQPNVRYRCRFRFHAEDASLANVLLLRIGPRDGLLSYNSIDRSAGYMSQSLLLNSPPGQWETRVVHYQTDGAVPVYPHLVLWGNPCAVWLADFEVTSEPYQIKGAKTDFQDSVTPEQLPGLLAARPDATAQVTVRDGRSSLLLNGQPIAPVIYKSEPYHTEGDFRRFGEAGVKLATVSVRLGTNKGAPGIWLGKDKYDFAPAEAALRKALLRNPQAHIILDVNFYPYPAWGEEHPGECWVNAEGQRAYGSWGNVDGFTNDLGAVKQDRFDVWYYPSYQSPVWQEEAGRAAAALIGHLRQTPYNRTIVGYYLTGGHDGQFQVLGDYDYSPATQEAFRQWLQAKYATIEKLRAAWGEAPASFEQVTVPPPLQKSGNLEAAPPYLTLGPDVDYRTFALERAWLLRDAFARLVKQAAGKPVVTIAYGNPDVYDFWPAFGLKYLDGSASMSYYPYRNPGYALGFKPYAGFPQHGKLFFQELDTRSWVGTVHADEVYEMWIGAGLTPDTWRAVNRKLAGFSLAGGTGFWYYDMNHFFDAPEIMAEIGRTAAVAARLAQRPPRRFRPDVCVVETSGANRFLGSPFASQKSSAFYQLMALEQSGVPYDRHYLTDVLSRPELQQYRLYVFLQTRFLTDTERAQIKAKLQRGGKTLVWVHDAGYLGEGGKSVAAMSDLLGLTVRTAEEYGRLTPVLDTKALPGVRPVLGLNEMLMTIMVAAGQSSFAAREQPFWIEDAKTTPLAHYVETGQVAAAVRQLPGWKSVYLAAASSLTGDLLNALARQAGAYVAGPAGQSLTMSGDFVSLHGLRSGPYPLRVPSGVKEVRDADTQQPLPLRNGVCTLNVRAQETLWLELR